MVKKIFLNTILLLGTALQASSQLQNNGIVGVQTPCTTTSQGAVGNFIISYTIGEMPLIESYKSNGLFITQGIIQPKTSIADTAYECFSQTEVTVYPNPNPGIFSLQLSILKKGTIQTNLFDATGKLLQREAFEYITFTTKKYSITQLPNAVYYLQLFFTEAGTNKAKKCVYTIQKIN
jgi:Secretion system C-terminal sorting domain